MTWETKSKQGELTARVLIQAVVWKSSAHEVGYAELGSLVNGDHSEALLGVLVPCHVVLVGDLEVDSGGVDARFEVLVGDFGIGELTEEAHACPHAVGSIAVLLTRQHT